MQYLADEGHRHLFGEKTVRPEYLLSPGLARGHVLACPEPGGADGAVLKILQNSQKIQFNWQSLLTVKLKTADK